MILAPELSCGDAFFIEQLSELDMNARVVTRPKEQKGSSSFAGLFTCGAPSAPLEG